MQRKRLFFIYSSCRSLSIERWGTLGIDLEGLDRLGDHGPFHLTLMTEFTQGGDDDVLGTDLEVTSQVVPPVRASESVCPQGEE